MTTTAEAGGDVARPAWAGWARERWLLLVVTVLGAALRLDAVRQDLFADELATYWIVRSGGVGHVVRTVATDAEISPPLGFVLAELSTAFGDHPALIRLPALLGGVASIPLTYLVGRRTVGATAGLLGAALVALSPFMVFYAAEARGYGVLMALVLLSTLSVLRAVEGQGARWWVLYAVAVCASCYTHYTGAFVLGAQLVWVLAVHPPARRPVLLATAAAAVGYLPWLPSLRADMRSPTTTLLGILSPMDPGSIGAALSQWSVGFPAANLGYDLPHDVSGSSLLELPGPLGVLLLGAFAVVALAGARRARRARRTPPGGGHEVGAPSTGRVGLVVLVVVLAVASPVGSALQSAVGTNVFRTRSMAPSWPYLGLALAALAVAGAAAWRRAATALLVAAFLVAAVVGQGARFERPGFRHVVEVAEARGAGVVVQAATWTPGPLTNFEVEGSRPSMPVLRLTVPEQQEEPFWFDQPRPVPEEVAARAVDLAGDRPILVALYDPPLPEVAAFEAALPDGYDVTEVVEVPGIFRIEVRLYERTG